MCFPASIRSASFIALAVCSALFAWRVAAVDHDLYDPWFVAGPLTFAALVALLMSAAVAVFLRLSRSPAPGGALAWFVMAVALALLLALPVGFGYDDGCNDHGTIVPLGTLPLMVVLRPVHGGVAYSDWQTLVACLGS